jgi:hypothetical protein
MGTMLDSFAPRLTTMLILSGVRPALAAASMPSSTRATGKSTSFIARNVASSSESRLTVTRFRPGVAQALRFFRKQRAVGGQCQIEVADGGEHLDQPFDVPAQQRLTARKADFRNTLVDEQSGDARNLFERQQFGVRQKWIVTSEDILWHAIDAAEVAAVGNRDAKVVEPSPAGVDDRCSAPRRA